MSLRHTMRGQKSSSLRRGFVFTLEVQFSLQRSSINNLENEACDLKLSSICHLKRPSGLRAVLHTVVMDSHSALARKHTQSPSSPAAFIRLEKHGIEFRF